MSDININDEIDAMLEALATHMGISKTEVIVKGVRLLDLATKAAEDAKEGNK